MKDFEFKIPSFKLRRPSYSQHTKFQIKRFKKTIFFFSLLCLFFFCWIIFLAYFSPSNTKAAWFDDNWAYRQSITITNSTGSTQTNIQKLLTIDTSSATGIGNKLQGSCQDLRFTSVSGKLLPYYIDSGCTTSTTKVWVLIDSLPSSNAAIYMYYGNPSAPTGSNSTQFDNLVGLVTYFTLNDGSGSATTDSSINATNGTVTIGGSGTQTTTTQAWSNGATGQYGGSINLDGSDDLVSLADRDGLTPASITVSAWIKRGRTGAASQECFINKGDAATNANSSYEFCINTNNTAYFEVSDGSVWKTATSVTALSSTSSWYHLVGTYDGSNVKMYLNGVLEATTADTTAVVNDNNSLRLAQAGAITTYNFQGQIDDFKLYNTARTATQISTDFSTTYTIATSGVSITSAFGSEEQAPSPTFYWKFDEAQGTTANDSTSNANSGTLGGTTKPTWQTEDQCISGKCLYFDGSTSKVTGSKAVKGVKSVAFWIRPNSFGTNGIMTLNDGSSRTITANSSGVIAANNFTSPTYYLNGISTGSTGPTLLANRWNFVEITTGTGVDSGTAIQIGSDGTNFIKGFIDEVKLYPTARSASQVTTDYTARGDLIGSSENLVNSSNIPALSDGLVGLWKFDETSAWATDCSTTSITDSSGNGNNGKPCPNASAVTQSGTAKFYKSASFDGTNDYIDSGNGASLQVTGALTLSAWVNLTSNNAVHDIIAKKGASGSFGYRLFTDASGKLNMEVSSDGTATTAQAGSTTVTTSAWHHVTGIYIPRKSITVYLDGVQDGQNTTSIPSAINNPSTNLNLGAENTGGSNFMSGQVDDGRVYNRALSNTEVSQLYNYSPGPVGKWELDEGSGSTANDTSGNANQGTITAGTGGYVTGKYGKAYNFDKANTKIDAGNGASLNDLKNGAGLSAEAWIYPKSVGEGAANGGVIIGKATGPSNTPANGWFLLLTTSNAIKFTTDGSTDLVRTTSTTAGNVVTLNAWNHVSVTWDGSITATNVHIYINGAEANSYATSTNGVSLTSDATPTLIIGNDSTQADTFDGYIDNVKVYNYPRAQRQVIEDLNAGHPAPGSPIGTPVGWWKFEDAGNTTTSSSGNRTLCSCAGSLSGFSVPATSTSGWTQDGKFGKAFIFDGSADDQISVSATSNVAIDITSDLTLSAWIKLTTNNAAHDIVGKTSSSATFGYRLFTDSSGKLNMQVSTNGTAYVTGTGATTLATGTWYHVVGVYKPSTSITVYVNGIQDGQNTSSIPATIFDTSTSANLLIGMESSAGSQRMNGTIDEVKIYNESLTPDQIKIDMNRNQVQILGALSDNSSYQKQGANQEYCIPGDSTSCAAPVADWKFEEGTGTTTFDSSTNNRDGTLTNVGGGSPPTWTNGKFGKALKFVTANNSYVEIVANFAPPATPTICVWVNLSNGSLSNDTILEKATGSDIVINLRLENVGGVEVVYAIFRTSGVNSTLSGNFNFGANINAWHQICVTRNGSSVGNIYIDGKIDATGTLTAPTDQTADWWIGNSEQFGGSTFPGKLDQLRIYDYVRTPAQIAWEYNQGKPVDWYKFDECQGTVAHDSSGNSYTGTINIVSSGSYTAPGTCSSGTSTDAWNAGKTGKHNYSLALDGTDDYVSSAATFTPLAPSTQTTKNASWGGWFLPSRVATQEVLIDMPSTFHLVKDILAGPPREVLFCGIGSIAGGTDGGNVVYQSSGSWMHIICTYDGVNIKTYINGILKNTTAQTANITSTAATIYIGARNNLTANLQGQVDDIKIWNYPLTSSQVLMDYNGGAVNFAPVTGAP